MMDVIIYGGSFDPPHLIHYEAARMGLVYADEVWMMPVYKHTDKKLFASYELRCHLVHMMVYDNSADKASWNIKVSSFEKECGLESGQTFNVLSALIKKYPLHNFKFMMGLDAACTIETWYNFGELLTLVPFIILTRDSEKKENLPKVWQYPDVNMVIQDMPRWSDGVSSSEIRRSIYDCDNLWDMKTDRMLTNLSKSVFDYYAMEKVMKGI